MSFTNLNFVKEQMHLPGLSDNAAANITRVAFYRRKPRGFSNGHYLQISPEVYTNSRAVRVKTLSFYIGSFLIFNGLFALQQRKKRGNWSWVFGGEYNQHVPPYFNDDYLRAIKRYKE